MVNHLAFISFLSANVPRNRQPNEALLDLFRLDLPRIGSFTLRFSQVVFCLNKCLVVGCDGLNVFVPPLSVGEAGNIVPSSSV